MAFLVGPSGFQIVDVTVASSPVVMSTMRLMALATDVKVSGQHAFIAQGPFGLTVVDVTDPKKPFVVGHELLVGLSRSLDVKDGLAYVATGVFGIQVVDVHDPTAPEWKETVLLKDLVTDVTWYENLIVANGILKGVSIFATPLASGSLPLATFKPKHQVDAIAVSQKQIHLDEGRKGVEVYSIANPNSPVKTQSYKGDRPLLDFRFSGLKAVKIAPNGVDVHTVSPE
jgi:hypothetical protein